MPFQSENVERGGAKLPGPPRVHEVALVVDPRGDALDGRIVESGGQRLRTITARDTTEAFEMAKTFRPDLVVLDVTCPETNGADFARRLKRDVRTRLAAVVLSCAGSIVGTLHADSDARHGDQDDMIVMRPWTGSEIVMVVEERPLSGVQRIGASASDLAIEAA